MCFRQCPLSRGHAFKSQMAGLLTLSLSDMSSRTIIQWLGMSELQERTHSIG